MLTIDNLHAYYGKSHVLHGVSFDVAPGEIVALLGRNGSGRSPTAQALLGPVPWGGALHRGEGMGGGGWGGGGRGMGGGGRSPARRLTRLPTWGWAMCRKAATYSPTSRCSKTCCSAKRAMARRQARAAAGHSTTCTGCFRCSRSASTPRPA